MIKVYYKKVDGIIESIELSGHAMYEDLGKDIVCAGVSSALTTTINAILTFDNEAIEYNSSNPFNLKNIKKDNITNALLDNFIEVKA